MFKIHLAKFTAAKDEESFNKAIEYLEANKASFGIELDFNKARLQARLHRQHVL